MHSYLRVNILERQHEVVAGLPELLDRAVGRAVNEAGPVVVKDGAKRGGGVARPNLILALFVDLYLLL